MIILSRSNCCGCCGGCAAIGAIPVIGWCGCGNCGPCIKDCGCPWPDWFCIIDSSARSCGSMPGEVSADALGAD